MAGGDIARATLNITMPIIPIVVPLLVHFFFVSFALVDDGWLPDCYFFSHLILLIVGLWAVKDKTSIQAVIVFIIVLLMTGLFDIVILSLYFESNNTTSRRKFAEAMCIINLLLKPATLLFAVYAVYVRNGSLNCFSGLGDQYNILRGSATVENPSPSAPAQ